MTNIGLGISNALAVVLLTTTIPGCGGAGEGLESTGQIQASLTQIPGGVLCVQITVSRTNTVTAFGVMSGQNSASFDIGPIPAGTTTVQAAAFNLACASVTSSTRPDWVGSPVSVNVKPGVNPQVNLTLLPNVSTSVGVGFVTPAIAIAAGLDDNFAISAAGKVRAWGSNTFGQLGDGTTTTRISPVASTVLGAVGPVASIGGGAFHSCLVDAQSVVQCWGLNSTGQLGDGTTTNRTTPVTTTAVRGVKSLTAGLAHTCFVTTGGFVAAAGLVYCTGSNSEGQLGTGSTTNSSFFVNALSSSEQVAAGFSFTCARTIAGSVACWGSNLDGQIGIGSVGGMVTSPASIPFFGAVAEVGAGGAHACARKYDGTVWCWGQNTSGQLGDGSTISRSSPAKVSGLSTASQIAVGNDHTCARLQDSSVRCWGRNLQGQLGDGTGTDSSIPVSVRNLTGVVELTAGISHSCARLDSGLVMCWGLNIAGEIGDGTMSTRFLPTNVAF